MAVSVGVGTSDEKKKDIIAVYWQEIVLTLKANFFVPFEQFKDNWDWLKWSLKLGSWVSKILFQIGRYVKKFE